MAIDYSAVTLFCRFVFNGSFLGAIEIPHIPIIFIMVKDLLQNILHNLPRPTAMLKNLVKSLYTDCLVSNRIQVPTLILWGDRDRIFPQKVAEAFKENILNSQIKYARGDHNWCLLFPEKFYNHVVKFIEG